MFDFLREKSNAKSSDQSSDHRAAAIQPGKQTLAGVYGAVKTTFVVGPNDPAEVRAAYDLLENAADPRERLVGLSKIVEVADHAPTPIASRLLDLVEAYAKPYAQLQPLIAERRERVRRRTLVEAAAAADKARAQAIEDAKVSVPHVVRPAYDASLVAPGSLESQISQLDAQILVGQWGDVARRLNWLPDKELANYTYGPTNPKTLSFGKLAHVREAATKIGGFDRVVDAIDQADPNAKHIAQQYWKYEQMVEYGRSSGKWGFAAEQLSKFGDWDIADRLGRLTRTERLHIRENTKDQRVLDAIDKLEGTPEDRWKALKAALTAERWGEVAERMNGLGDEELKKYAAELTPGQRAHIYGSASAAMPGFAGRVKGVVATDNNIAEVGERYTALETALAKAKADGSWSDLAKHINVMNPYDVTMYLKQLDDGQLTELERTPVSAAVRASIEKTRAGRLDAVRREYTRAIAVGDWRSAARQLSQLPPSDIEHDVEAILARPDGKKDLARIRAAAGSVPDGYRTIEWIDRFHPDALPSVPPPVTHTIPVPDVSGDRRALAGLSLENFGGHDDIRAFAQAIANEEGKRLVGHDKHKRDEQHIIADTFEALREGFITTAAYEPRATFAEYAMAWMYETREMHEATSKYEGADPSQWFNKMYSVVNDSHVPPIDEPLVDFGGNSGWMKDRKKGKVKVHPVVNAFLAKLGEKYPCFTSTYENHGSHVWEPFCVDVAPTVMPKDERGLYERGAAMQFLDTVDDILRNLNASWRAIYDDADFVDYANKKFGVVSHDTSKAGDTPVPVPTTPNYNVDPPRASMTGDQGSKNWHGGLNLHFHFYVIPNNASVH